MTHDWPKLQGEVGEDDVSVSSASRVESDQRKKEVRNDNWVSQPSERNGLATGEGGMVQGMLKKGQVDDISLELRLKLKIKR